MADHIRHAAQRVRIHAPVQIQITTDPTHTRSPLFQRKSALRRNRSLYSLWDVVTCQREKRPVKSVEATSFSGSFTGQSRGRGLIHGQDHLQGSAAGLRIDIRRPVLGDGVHRVRVDQGVAIAVDIAGGFLAAP